jgi:hypothetical protein
MESIMKYILAILTLFLGSSVAKAGDCCYNYYVQPHYVQHYAPQFYVAPQIIPVIVHHKNFIDKFGDKRVQKIELFAPVYVEQHSYYRPSYPHPNLRR